jgi:hypothetical protein
VKFSFMPLLTSGNVGSKKLSNRKEAEYLLFSREVNVYLVFFANANYVLVNDLLICRLYVSHLEKHLQVFDIFQLLFFNQYVRFKLPVHQLLPFLFYNRVHLSELCFEFVGSVLKHVVNI